MVILSKSNNEISKFLFNLLSKIYRTNQISTKDILKLLFILYLTNYIELRIGFDIRIFIMLLFSYITKKRTKEETIVKGGIKKIIRKY